MVDEAVSLLQRASSVLFLPIRKATGPLHRRRSALTSEQAEREQNRTPVGGQWAGDDRWYAAGTPPRAHNLVRPLPHGMNYFHDLVQVLAQARQRVTIVGWSMTPLMSLERGDDSHDYVLADLLRDASRRAEVYVLLWAGAPALFEPNVRYTEAVQRTLAERAPAVHCELDRRAHFSHDHHQKAVTVDGRIAYVGGIDLSTFQGDRWDTEVHELRFGPNWHDVQTRLEGEVVPDVEKNFCQRWNAVTGEHLEPLPPGPTDPSWNTPAQIVRTVPAGFYPFEPEGEFGIRHAILAAIRGAQRFVYLENQYIWDPDVVEALCEAIQRHRDDKFRIVLVLPARAYTGRYDNDHHVQELRSADAGHGVFEAYSLYASGPAIGRTGYAYLPIYVHAKVGIVDDQWLTIGSANLNRRGLGTDTEMNVQAVDDEVARNLRIRLWAEHLGVSADELRSADPVDVIDGLWKDTARECEACAEAGGLPARGQVRRYAVNRTPTSRALDMVQDLTLEH